MESEAYTAFLERSRQPQALERTIEYLTEHLSRYLKKQERVIICFSRHEQGNLSWLMEQAVLRSGAVPFVWGPDRRWKTLLRMAFSSKATVFIGAPLIALGLTKLSKYCAIPLYIRKVVTAGYPCLDWMVEGIAKGFDCETGGCFGVGLSAAVAGFACGQSWGVHLREAEYGVDIVDQDGRVLPPGKLGQVVLYPVDQPSLRLNMGDNARLVTTPCRCGSPTARLMDFATGDDMDPELVTMSHELLNWTSVLDCRMKRGRRGLALEAVVFAGEKLPKFPMTAKRAIRPWSPETDEPFWYEPIRDIF